MKKKIFYGVVALAITVGAALTITENFDKQDKKQVAAASAATKPESNLTPKYIFTAQDKEKAQKEMGEVNDEITLDSWMLILALQKIDLNENEKYQLPGSIVRKRLLFTKENVIYLKQRARDLDVSPVYNEILEKWSSGDFTDMLEDFWKMRGVKAGPENGEIPPSFSQRTKEEEKRYILYFFGEEGLERYNQQWNESL